MGPRAGVRMGWVSVVGMGWVSLIRVGLGVGLVRIQGSEWGWGLSFWVGPRGQNGDGVSVLGVGWVSPIMVGTGWVCGQDGGGSQQESELVVAPVHTTCLHHCVGCQRSLAVRL